MLDSFIIEEIRRRERMREERNRPVMDLPLPSPDDDRPPRRSDTENEEKPQRGVVVIDLLG